MSLSVHTLTDLRLDIRHSSAHGVEITCEDPLIVRADLLVVADQAHQRGATLGAVIDGVMTDLGLISDDVLAALARTSDAAIHAPHFAGGHVTRRVPITRQ